MLLTETSHGWRVMEMRNQKMPAALLGGGNKIPPAQLPPHHPLPWTLPSGMEPSSLSLSRKPLGENGHRFVCG